LIQLLAALLLGASSTVPPAAPAAAVSASPAAPAPAGAQAPAPAAEAPPDAEVMSFLSLTRTTASRDGGVKLPWDGPGAAQLKLSWDALDRRNEQLAMGDMMARAVMDSVRMFFDTAGGSDPDAMRAKLVSLTGAPMEEAKASYLAAIGWEERRLFFVSRAAAQAAAEQVTIPGVDAGLVSRRLHAIRSGAVRKALSAQLDGYTDLALGLVAYSDGDSFRALEKVRGAVAALPELAVAHAFLGSMYFLFDQKDAAVKAWRRAYALDPTNESVREALQEYGRPERRQPQSRSR
jgi:tetratricopeptide (TPR) repeat protein